MSFKGFQKSVVRAPQQIRQKFNIGEHTKDPIYTDAERRFDELEAETKHLHDSSKLYFEAVNGMLSHQIEFSKAMTEIYKPISGRMSDPMSLEVQGNIEGIRACEEYEAVVKDLQETLAPELEMIDSRVIRPANELLDVIKVIRKTAVKRDHKKLDYDRHRATLKKLQEKKEKTAKDEKATWKAETDVEQSTQEFNYFNDLLKDELPKLFALEREFIQPLFQSFYYMQLNIFYTLHEKMQGCDIGYFDLTLDIEEAFLKKRGDIQEQAEKLTIVRFKTSGMKRPPKYGPPKPALEGTKPAGLLTEGPSDSKTAPSTSSLAPRPAWQRESDSGDQPPPPYTAGPVSPALGGSLKPSLASKPVSPVSPSFANGKVSSLAAAAAAKSKPPPPKPKPSRLAGQAAAAETVTALFDYSAQAEGDLSFRAGDVIEIVQRTNNDNEWWTGKLHGKQGQFPGNYVKLNS
ncbi:reduced viability upon starvation protein [Cercophora newfieldiana]|uniref:Reduced viability upon starvation protein n=1 Tax=Cercophora newfieldiana TaxID=92897 RepID=A0AA40CHA3_9PEZI|nr:reduced viability upon starvation protein [Cercophora newfieldiana]